MAGRNGRSQSHREEDVTLGTRPAAKRGAAPRPSSRCSRLVGEFSSHLPDSTHFGRDGSQIAGESTEVSTGLSGFLVVWLLVAQQELLFPEIPKQGSSQREGVGSCMCVDAIVCLSV